MEDFNLKKFLVENKLTANSRLLKEEATNPINYEKLKQILTLASNTFPEDDEDGSPLYEKGDIKRSIKAIMTLAKGVADEDEDVFDKLEDNPPSTLEGVVNLTDVQDAKWEDFDMALSMVSDIAYEYDFYDAAIALNGLAREVDKFEL